MARKWKQSEFEIHDIGQLLDSMTYYGGVWDVLRKRFSNKAFILSQQFRIILIGCRRGDYFYPERIKKGSEVKDGNN